MIVNESMNTSHATTHDDNVSSAEVLVREAAWHIGFGKNVDDEKKTSAGSNKKSINDDDHPKRIEKSFI